MAALAARGNANPDRDREEIGESMSRATSPASDAKKKPRSREPWIIRTYAGFGDARQANRRFLENLKPRPARTLDRFRPADPKRL